MPAEENASLIGLRAGLDGSDLQWAAMRMLWGKLRQPACRKLATAVDTQRTTAPSLWIPTGPGWKSTTTSSGLENASTSSSGIWFASACSCRSRCAIEPLC
jgi:hypothetical protein